MGKLLLLAASLLSSCASFRRVTQLATVTNYCAPSAANTYVDNYRPQVADSPLLMHPDTSLMNHFSKLDLLMANAAGVLPLLQQLTQ